jgi:hypothetical protein
MKNNICKKFAILPGVSKGKNVMKMKIKGGLPWKRCLIDLP